MLGKSEMQPQKKWDPMQKLQVQELHVGENTSDLQKKKNQMVSTQICASLGSWNQPKCCQLIRKITPTMLFSLVKYVINSLLFPGSCFLWSLQLVLFTQVPHFSVILSAFLVRMLICYGILHTYGSFCYRARTLRIQCCRTHGT